MYTHCTVYVERSELDQVRTRLDLVKLSYLSSCTY